MEQIKLAQRLSECGIQNDETIQLSARHSHSWRLMNDLNSLIHDLCNCNDNIEINANVARMRKMLTKFLAMIRKGGAKKSEEYLLIFIHSAVPAALVKLYVSPSVTAKEAAHGCICHCINSCKTLFPSPVTVYRHCAPICLKFCKILRGVSGVDDALYIFCRSSLAALMEWYEHDIKSVLRLQDVFPFVHELASNLAHSLEMSERSAEFTWLSSNNVDEFIKFLHPVKCAIRLQEESRSPDCYLTLMQGTFNVFFNLLEKLDLCLKKLESQLGSIDNVCCWCWYLLILKELKSLSKLSKCLEEIFWDKMRQRRYALCFLILKVPGRYKEYRWILKHKEVTFFRVRQSFALKMLREGSYRNEEVYEMLICRSRLFEESFEYIGHVDSRLLGGHLFMQFKNEEATGPGVLREWFSLVCQAIFNRRNALFVSCPNDGTRFFPNPASKVDPSHLEYFIFSGRMIALALLHKVQISIEFDRVFFLQLAGENISIEDIRDADPYLYYGCKKILEMDTKMVDEDILGLTFVCEDEELGSRKVVELFPNGKDTIVNSENRDKYVDLLVKHRFVTSITHQVAHFAQGFADIIIDGRLRESFFQILDHEDFNRMLHGSKVVVSVEDWKEHTNYNGYKKTDPQISWFWEIVGRMSSEQRNVLLFFWTSIKSLPVDGFGGLDSKLHIYRTSESHDFLPSSRTCFYRLCFPPYPSMDVMQNRINIITQNHIGCSFGAE